MLAAGQGKDDVLKNVLRKGARDGIALRPDHQLNPDDLAVRATTSDASGAPLRSIRQQEGYPMSQSSNGNGGQGPAGAGNAPGDSLFTKPAPEGAAKKVSEVLGEIVWLMSQSPLHKQFFISDLEWFVMTPILLQQFRLFYDKDKPIGVTFWATVNKEVEERLKN